MPSEGQSHLLYLGSQMDALSQDATTVAFVEFVGFQTPKPTDHFVDSSDASTRAYSRIFCGALVSSQYTEEDS